MNRLLGAVRCRRLVWSATLALAALAIFSAADASAQRRGGRVAHPVPVVAAPAGPTAEQTAAARTAYGEGQRLFHDGQFAQAQAQFEAAFAAVPNPVALLSVAEAQERQGKVADAVATLERYLTLRADAPDRAAVQARIDQMRTRPGVIAVSSDPAGAAISLDGTDTGRVTPADIEAAVGDHAVSLSLEGYEPAAAQTVTVTFGSRQELAVPALTALPPLPVDVTPPPFEGEGSGDGEETEDEGPGAAVWISAGVGAAGLVAGTVLGFLALSEQASFDTTPTEASADSGERLALFADVGFGVAVAGFITALVLNFANGSDDEEEGEPEAAAPTARLHLAPVVGPSGGGLTARLSF